MAMSGSGGRVLKAAVGVLAVAAAAGGTYYVWSKRKAAARASLTGEEPWATGHPAGAEVFDHAAAAAAFQPGMADTQSPDVVDEQFAREVDAEADQLAEEIVTAVEGPHGVAEPVAEDEPFEAGMAADQSPDTIDPGFAAEVDAAADQFAGDIVEAVEEPKG
ncbi:MAG: hypothetical protein MUD13_11565 [Candidatus Nanopelagicales bacterium]|nr:hypothetical protein [Candidatus Nanopelagicales bacterium]